MSAALLIPGYSKSVADSTEIGGSARAFPSTSWSMVRAATDRSRPEWRERLEGLVRAYWKPVYHYIRAKWRKGNEDAKDLAQGFFALLFEGGTLDRLAPEHGTLRGYLKAALAHHLVDEARRSEALKRGGGVQRVSIDLSKLRGALADPAALTPEELFDREWVSTCFSAAVQDLERALASEGKELHFRLFKRYYLDPQEAGSAAPPPSYASVAAEHGIEAYDVSNHLVHARRRLQELLRERICDYSASDLDARDELRFILGE